ncbi:hypothetical protein V1505DRAFT_390863 [Lipomyces doorenjongii]
MKPAYILALGLSLVTSTMAYQVHNISVGQGALDYSPNTVTASVGDYVQFTFLTGTHGVAQASYDSPCTPYSDSTEGAGKNGIYSGLIAPYTNYSPTYTIRINSTDPIWFYCPEAYPVWSVPSTPVMASPSQTSPTSPHSSRTTALRQSIGAIGDVPTSPSNVSVTSVASTSTSVAASASIITISATSSSAAAASSSVSAANVNVASGAILITALAAGLRLFA